MKTSLVLAITFLSVLNPLRAIEYALYVKERGEGWSVNTDGGIAGTTGQARKTDAFSVSGFPFKAEFRIHVESQGWLPWAPCDGNFLSGNGQSLEGIEFRFPDGLPKNTKLLGRAHVEGKGWMKTIILEEGVILGTTGESKRLEAVQLCLGEGSQFTNTEKAQATIDALSVAEINLRGGHWTAEEAGKYVGRSPAGIEEACAIAIASNFLSTLALKDCYFGGPKVCAVAAAGKVLSITGVALSCTPDPAEFSGPKSQIRDTSDWSRDHRKAIERFKSEGGPYRAPAGL